MARLLAAVTLDLESHAAGRLEGLAIAKSGQLSDADLEGLATLNRQLTSAREQAGQAIRALCPEVLARHRDGFLSGSLEAQTFVEGVLAGIADVAATVDPFRTRR